ncbi:hypothetical protein RAC89_12935 [Paenibacillus sp. GD4]|jgi:hypothetical protein|uniref:hypothetical protein n=1 Tax=Paenibacillus sp. GD4 TaxID=3068890 RepID=UPI0027969473|nr:hypothetical protein [Paenibacillus sp. GD4]MDQ1911353.1 hypothetical protein [Paenibacillus sp. GD4]
MRGFIILMLAVVALSAGCQSRADQDTQLDIKSLQKTVGKERISMTLTQVANPSMDKSIMDKSDTEIIAWIKSIDAWTHQVLSAPVTGEMDQAAAMEIRNHLAQVYTQDAADKLIDYFYRRDLRTGTYQANSTDAMLGMRSEWGSYQLRKEKPSGDQYRIRLTGRTQHDVSESVMQHISVYQVQGDRLVIKEFTTHS